MKKETNFFQVIWGAALVLMGFAIFYRIPQVWPSIEELDIFRSVLPFIRFCFYLLGVILIGGGAKKLYDQFLRSDEKNAGEQGDRE